MSSVPKRFADITPEQIEEWGYLGISEGVIFNLLALNEKQRKQIRKTDKWNVNYAKGLARREIELAEKLLGTKDPQLIKELLKSTSLTEKKIVDDRVEFEIDAPSWIKPIRKRKRNENKDKRDSV